MHKERGRKKSERKTDWKSKGYGWKKKEKIFLVSINVTFWNVFKKEKSGRRRRKRKSRRHKTKQKQLFFLLDSF